MARYAARYLHLVNSILDMSFSILLCHIYIQITEKANNRHIFSEKKFFYYSRITVLNFFIWHRRMSGETDRGLARGIFLKLCKDLPSMAGCEKIIVC